MQEHTSSVTIPLRAYAAVLRKRPLEALEIAWWWITRRKRRARNRFGTAAASLPSHYRIWLSMQQPIAPRGREAGRAAALERGTRAPLAVHVHVGRNQVDTATAAITSALDQLTPQDVLYVSSAIPLPAHVLSVFTHSGRVLVLPDLLETQAEALGHVLNQTDAAYLIPLDARATLTPGTIGNYARALSEHQSEVRILYADQDEYGPMGERRNPWLKPEWDEDLFLGQDYLSAACLLPVAAAREAGIDKCWPDEIAVYALLERLLHGPASKTPGHLPFIAVTTPAQAWQQASAVRAKLVGEATGIPVSQGPFGTVVLHRALPDPPPRVSVIVPTRDRLDLLETCISGVLHSTDYPDLELIVADNGSVEPETMAYFDKIVRDPRVKIVRWPHPYNYSAINNFAIGHASGAYACLLNNDTEVTDPSWLRAMMGHAIRPEVGAVGARLLYPDRSVQHAGVVVGMGGAAGHAHRGLPDGEPGWFAQALVTRGATAVTAACLVIAKDKFDAVGGLDEDRLAIAYNDVDLCLKLRAAGWRNLYVPQAVLIHHESKSRGLDFAPEHLARYMRELAVFRERWGTVNFSDPMHHPGLDAGSETYRLKF